MSRILWDDRAERDVLELVTSIGRRDPAAGRRFLHRVRAEAEVLAEFPRIGATRKGHSRSIPGLRCWPIAGFQKYLIFYAPLGQGDGIHIFRILHGARDVDRA